MRTQVQLQIFFGLGLRRDSVAYVACGASEHAVGVPGRRHRWPGPMGRRQQVEPKVRRVTGGNQAVGDSGNDVVDV